MSATDIISFQCFTHEQVKEINKKIKKNIFQKEEPSDAADGYETTKIGNFFHVPCMPLMKLVHPWLHQCQRANGEIFGYDIYWNFHLDEFNYNVYGMGGEYGWHIDANEKKLFDAKLTCLLNLSEEPYGGGGFYSINSNEKIEFTSGMGIIFTSLIAHKVTPVTKGERITLTYWGTGPGWR
jgi:hypothetical protein